MAACEIPCARASFLKSASQRSKLPVLRQLAFCAMAEVAVPAIRATTVAPAKLKEAREGSLYRIGLSVVSSMLFSLARGRRSICEGLLADLAATRLSWCG